jgi:hypothetical protein
MPVVLCDDSELDYLASRTKFAEGQPLRLDDGYRLAHLPLVAPQHPGVIARRDGKPYDRGRRPPVGSLVLPVPGDALHQSLTSTGLDGELRRSPLATKVAWHILPRRRDRLHATLCSSLAGGPTTASIGATERTALAQVGPLTVELRGLFSGNINLGRLYLRAYPEKRQGLNAFHRIQDIMGYRKTGLYVVGLYNLIDDLDAAETALLAGLIERWWDKPLLRYQVDALWLLGASDDLVLDGGVVETIPLC